MILAHGGSCIYPNLPWESREPGNALSHEGHRNPFCRWKSTYTLVAVTIKIFQRAKRASVKVVLPPWRIQSEPWGKKGIFLTGNRTVFTSSSSVKLTLPRKDDVSSNVLIPATYPAGTGIICIFGNRQLAFSKHVKFFPSAAVHRDMEHIGSLAQCYHFITNSWRSIFVLSLQFFVISFW